MPIPYPWHQPRILPWLFPNAPNHHRNAQLFVDFISGNPWLGRLLEPQFLSLRPLLGAPCPGRVADLLGYWFGSAYTEYTSNLQPWSPERFQQHLFSRLVANAILRHYLHVVVHDRPCAKAQSGDVFWPPAFYLVSDGRIFDFANYRPQAEFFEPGAEGTRHPAILIGTLSDGTTDRWYILHPLTSTGQGQLIQWTDLAGKQRKSNRVADWPVSATGKMLGQEAGAHRGGLLALASLYLEALAKSEFGVSCGKTPAELCDLVRGRCHPAHEPDLVNHVLRHGRCLATLQDLAGQCRPTCDGGQGVAGSAGGWYPPGGMGGDTTSLGQLFEAWQSFLSAPMAARPQPGPGQLWTTRATNLAYPGHERDGKLTAFDLLCVPHGVVVLEPPRSIGNLTEIRVAPVSLALDMAMEDQGDVVEDGKGSPGRLPLLIEVWNEQPMLTENLDSFVGDLSAETMKNVMARRGRFGPRSYAEIVLQGLDTDPRWRFRASEYEQTLYLRAPALAAREVFAPQSVRAWLQDLLSRGAAILRWTWAEVPRPARALAAAAPHEDARLQILETGDPRLHVVARVGSGGDVWLSVETSDSGLLGQCIDAWVVGHGAPVRAQIRELGEGRCGAVVFLGRLPEESGEPFVVSVAMVGETASQNSAQ